MGVKKKKIQGSNPTETPFSSMSLSIGVRDTSRAQAARPNGLGSDRRETQVGESRLVHCDDQRWEPMKPWMVQNHSGVVV